MNTPAQIISGLLAAGAAAFLPLSTRFQEAAGLQAAAEKKARTRDAAGAAPGSPESSAGPARSRSAAIPPALSGAEAGQAILEIAALDGKMLTSRELTGLVEKIMSLPASRMEEARAVIQESKNMIQGAFLYSALFARWGELDPESAKTALAAGSGSNPILKFAGSAALAGGWLEKDPDQFLKWVSDSPEGTSAGDRELKNAMMNGVLALTEVDGATADKLIAAAPRERRAWMIMDLAERDPAMDPRDAAARALEEAGGDENQRSQINWRLGRILADRDPREAIAYAEGQEDAKARGQTYESAMDSWLKKDKTAALKWLKDQPETVQADAIRGMRGETGTMSYEEVARLSGDVGAQAASSLWQMSLEQTAEKNPQEALRYLPGVSEDQRPAGYRQIAQNWTKKDPEGASTWIDPLPPGREKDQAIQGMVQELRTKEPDSSTIWASTISDEGTRDRLVSENVRLWLKRDRTAAEEWINSSETLSDEQRAKLLEVK